MTLLSLAIKCSQCGKRPAVRISTAEREQKQKEPDDAIVLSYQCRGCGEVYVITAKAYKGAA